MSSPATSDPVPSQPVPGENVTEDDDAAECAARSAAAEQIRRLHHSLVGHEQDPAALLALAERLRAVADQMERGARRSRPAWTGRLEKDVPLDGTEFALDFDRPVSGPGNPWSIPSPVVRDGDRITTTVVLGQGYEGAPGRSHGGIVAAIYDDLCGFNHVLAAVIAFTAWIRIDYRAPTPLHVPLTFSTWIEHHEGRKIRIMGECTSGDELISTCDSLFITVDPAP